MNLNVTTLYLPLILWALHQTLGTRKGDAVYAQLAPIITAVANAE